MSAAKKLVSLFFLLVILGLLSFYLFIPLTTTEFRFTSESDGRFKLNASEEMQFYPNMRFADKDISYQIIACPIQKESSMIRAFEIISNISELNFLSKANNEEITISCESKNKLNGAMFIAGEGGPVNITRTNGFNVITKGEILLIRDSQCETPNVELHELLHVLGFNHSTNPNNIMYPVSRCDQPIGSDIIQSLNELYSIPTLPDLSLENATALIQGMFLDTNITIQNEGLKKSGYSRVKIYADEELIKEIAIPELDIGYSITIYLKNILTKGRNIKELRYIIEYQSDELDKKNNKILMMTN